MKHLLCALLLLCAPLRADSLFDAPKTRALVIGVLSWKNPTLYSSFGTKDRRDAELARLLRDRGAE